MRGPHRTPLAALAALLAVATAVACRNTTSETAVARSTGERATDGPTTALLRRFRTTRRLDRCVTCHDG